MEGLLDIAVEKINLSPLRSSETTAVYSHNPTDLPEISKKNTVNFLHRSWTKNLLAGKCVSHPTSIPSIPFIGISTYPWEDPFFCTKSYSLTHVQ